MRRYRTRFTRGAPRQSRQALGRLRQRRGRLDVFNGFLLTANLDALFDRGLITFADSGLLICSARLNSSQLQVINLKNTLALRWLAPEHRPFLAWHREQVYVGRKLW